MKPFLILLTLAVLSAMILASPANPADKKPNTDASKKQEASKPEPQAKPQPNAKASPPNGTNKDTANQNSQAKKAASKKVKSSDQKKPPTGKGSEDKQAPQQSSTDKPSEKPTKRFVAFRSHMQ
ncbi:unnamed protein product [Chironomus riparius]|uniref:Uncharacterized protein n=1 Tax=Chironomus riparius TaxID=315576 RepID=A0A9N9X1A1_9DIPT|nr:unnamed protein product [Chironomus riparius]